MAYHYLFPSITFSTGIMQDEQGMRSKEWALLIRFSWWRRSKVSSGTERAWDPRWMASRHQSGLSTETMTNIPGPLRCGTKKTTYWILSLYISMIKFRLQNRHDKILQAMNLTAKCYKNVLALSHLSLNFHKAWEYGCKGGRSEACSAHECRIGWHGIRSHHAAQKTM